MTSIKPMTIAEGQTRRKNSIAIALMLGLLVALFYTVTLVRLKDNVDRNRTAMNQTSGAAETVTAPVAARSEK